jgi:hypothetical protein
MAPCVHCGKPTDLCVNNVPICPECDAKPVSERPTNAGECPEQRELLERLESAIALYSAAEKRLDATQGDDRAFRDSETAHGSYIAAVQDLEMHLMNHRCLRILR